MRGPAGRTKEQEDWTESPRKSCLASYENDSEGASLQGEDQPTVELSNRGADQLTTTSAPEGNGRFRRHRQGKPVYGQANTTSYITHSPPPRQVRDSRQFEQTARIGCSRSGNRIHVNAAQIGNTRGH